MSSAAEELELEPDAAPAAKAKPPRQRSTTSTRKRTRGKPSLAPSIQATLELVGGVWAIRDDVCGPALIDQAGNLAAGANAWAQADPKVYARIEKFLDGGAAAALLLAVGEFAIVVVQHHVVPAAERYRVRRMGEVPEEDEELAEELEAVAPYTDTEPPEREPGGYVYDPDLDPTRARSGS